MSNGSAPDVTHSSIVTDDSRSEYRIKSDARLIIDDLRRVKKNVSCGEFLTLNEHYGEHILEVLDGFFKKLKFKRR